MPRPTVEVDLASEPRIAKELAAGGAFIAGCALKLDTDCELILHAHGAEVLRLRARVVLVAPNMRGAAVEVSNWGPDVKAQIAALARNMGVDTPARDPLGDAIDAGRRRTSSMPPMGGARAPLRTPTPPSGTRMPVRAPTPPSGVSHAAITRGGDSLSDAVDQARVRAVGSNPAMRAPLAPLAPTRTGEALAEAAQAAQAAVITNLPHPEAPRPPPPRPSAAAPNKPVAIVERVRPKRGFDERTEGTMGIGGMPTRGGDALADAAEQARKNAAGTVPAPRPGAASTIIRREQVAFTPPPPAPPPPVVEEPAPPPAEMSLDLELELDIPVEAPPPKQTLAGALAGGQVRHRAPTAPAVIDDELAPDEPFTVDADDDLVLPPTMDGEALELAAEAALEIAGGASLSPLDLDGISNPEPLELDDHLGIDRHDNLGGDLDDELLDEPVRRRPAGSSPPETLASEGRPTVTGDALARGVRRALTTMPPIASTMTPVQPTLTGEALEEAAQRAAAPPGATMTGDALEEAAEAARRVALEQGRTRRPTPEGAQSAKSTGAVERVRMRRPDPRLDDAAKGSESETETLNLEPAPRRDSNDTLAEQLFAGTAPTRGGDALADALDTARTAAGTPRDERLAPAADAARKALAHAPTQLGDRLHDAALVAQVSATLGDLDKAFDTEESTSPGADLSSFDQEPSLDGIHESAEEADLVRKIPPGVQQRLRGLTQTQANKVASTGELQERVILERMYGKQVWEPLLRNPRLTGPEVARIARMVVLPRPLLEVIVGHPNWLAIPEVRRALLSNPRLSTEQILRVLRLLPKPELKMAAIQTAYPFAVRDAARRMLREDE